MNSREAIELGVQLGALIQRGETNQALARLEPVLNQKIPFRIVGRLGEALGASDLARLFSFLDRLAKTHTQGGWVIIGTALNQVYHIKPKQVMAKCADYIVLGDIWFAADILGERVPGPALVTDFHRGLALLEGWRESPNCWVRRAVGVAVHLWAKRSLGEVTLEPQAVKILTMLAPMFEEWEIDAVKGIGWGLKTIGKMYPNLLAGWLDEQAGRRHRAVMLRKALTYLSPEEKASILENFERRKTSGQ